MMRTDLKPNIPTETVHIKKHPACIQGKLSTLECTFATVLCSNRQNWNIIHSKNAIRQGKSIYCHIQGVSPKISNLQWSIYICLFSWLPYPRTMKIVTLGEEIMLILSNSWLWTFKRLISLKNGMFTWEFSLMYWKFPIKLCLSNTQSTLFGCSTLCQKYCKLIGWYWEIMRSELWTVACLIW